MSVVAAVAAAGAAGTVAAVAAAAAAGGLNHSSRSGTCHWCRFHRRSSLDHRSSFDHRSSLGHRLDHRSSLDHRGGLNRHHHRSRFSNRRSGRAQCRFGGAAQVFGRHQGRRSVGRQERTRHRVPGGGNSRIDIPNSARQQRLRHQTFGGVPQAHRVPDLVSQHREQAHPLPAPARGVHVNDDRATSGVGQLQARQVANRDLDAGGVGSGRLPLRGRGGRCLAKSCRAEPVRGGGGLGCFAGGQCGPRRKDLRPEAPGSPGHPGQLPRTGPLPLFGNDGTRRVRARKLCNQGEHDDEGHPSQQPTRQ